MSAPRTSPKFFLLQTYSQVGGIGRAGVVFFWGLQEVRSWHDIHESSYGGQLFNFEI